MIGVFRSVFRDECLSHDWDNPIITFEIANEGISEATGLAGRYGVLPLRALFWVQISLVLAVQSVFSVVLAIAVYYGIIQRRGSNFSFLFGWGIVIPLAVSFPFYALRVLDVRNRAVAIGTTATPILVGLRCIEALYGFSPHSVEKSLSNYCIYYSSVIEFVFDEKTGLPAVAHREDVWRKGRILARNFVMTSLLISFLEAHSYRPFGSAAGSLLSPGNLLNNFLLAVLTWLTVATGTVAFGFAICAVFGIRTLDVFDNPMFASASASDFWGRRWNGLIHGVLKRGVYKPVRKYSSSKLLAAVATFLSSGIIHEYTLLVLLSTPTGYPPTSDHYYRYVPSYGSQFCFFLWNGVLIAFEYLFDKWDITPPLVTTLPRCLRSLLVVLMALPVAHWFTNEYVNGGLFPHYTVAFPLLTKLK